MERPKGIISLKEPKDIINSIMMEFGVSKEQAIRMLRGRSEGPEISLPQPDIDVKGRNYSGDMIDAIKSNYNQGGRVGFQTGSTVQDIRVAPEWVESLGKYYASDLARQSGIPAITQATQQMPGETASQFAQRQAQAQQFDITQQSMGKLAPEIAGQDALQQAAYAQATDPTYGLGAYQDYAAKAATAADAAGALTGPMTQAQRTAYMSPYQQDVIDATMTEFDQQAQMRAN